MKKFLMPEPRIPAQHKEILVIIVPFLLSLPDVAPVSNNFRLQPGQSEQMAIFPTRHVIVPI